MSEGYREIMPDGKLVPEGCEFLELIWGQEYRCLEATDEWLPNAGEKAPQCLENLGTVLSFLDRLATCWWGCRGGDHIVEHLVGRAYSSARAALRLMRGGYYDEALSCVRSSGELANLLMLFRQDKESFQVWNAMDDAARRKSFSAFGVRKRLEKIDVPAAVDKDIYSALSIIGVHATPETIPQSYNPPAAPTTGGYFQPVGALTVLNELAYVAACVAAASAGLLGLEHAKATAVLDSARSLISSVGGVGIMGLEEMLGKLGEPTP